MDPLSAAAAAGMRSRLESLDLLANNLANSSTPGFKADRERYTLYKSEEALAQTGARPGAGAPELPLIESNWIDWRQGLLERTGNSLDFAIEGRGFFVVDGPSGQLLTRNGAFRLSADGRLVTAEGYELATVEPRRIRAAPGEPIDIDPDGVVRQQGNILGRLKLADLPDSASAVKRSGLYFSLDLPANASLPAARGSVRQAHLEQSNIGPAQSAVRLVEILRQFESLQRAAQIGAEMGRRSVEEVARVTS
jgi:flagellar basal body rod protein FlgG